MKKASSPAALQPSVFQPKSGREPDADAVAQQADDRRLEQDHADDPAGSSPPSP